jgi:hypothetical protein
MRTAQGNLLAFCRQPQINADSFIRSYWVFESRDVRGSTAIIRIRLSYLPAVTTCKRGGLQDVLDRIICLPAHLGSLALRWHPEIVSRLLERQRRPA